MIFEPRKCACGNPAHAYLGQGCTTNILCQSCYNTAMGVFLRVGELSKVVSNGPPRPFKRQIKTVPTRDRDQRNA